MAQLLLRGLDEKVIAGMRSRAKSQGRTLQTEAKMVLETASRINPEAARALCERIQRDFAGRRFSDSGNIQRQMRGR